MNHPHTSHESRTASPAGRLNPHGPGGSRGLGAFGPPPQRRLAAMAVLLAVNFMILLDVSIVNVALPDLQSRLGANDRQLEWVVEAYVLAYALCLLPFGRLGDIVGRRLLFVAGIVGFGLTSLACGLAPDIGTLILARAAQGVSSAMMSPQVMAIAATLFAPHERARTFSLFGLVAGISGVAGPLASGLLLHANFFQLGWRQIFLINVPLVLGILGATFAFVPRLPPHPGLRNDVVGIGLSAVAIFALVYPLVEGRAYGWPAWTFGFIVAALALLAAFIAWEYRQSKRGASALLPVSLLSHRDFVVGVVALLVFFSALQGFFLVYAVFLQQGLGFTPLQAGLSTAPFPVGLLVATLLGARVPNLRPKIVTGASLLAAVFATLGLIVYQAGDALVSPLHFLLPLFIGGAGTGLVISSLFQAVMRTVPLKDAGAGSGAAQVFQQVGAAVGIALVSALFYTQVATATARPDLGFRQGFLHAIVYEVAACLLVAALAFVMKLKAPLHGPSAETR